MDSLGARALAGDLLMGHDRFYEQIPNPMRRCQRRQWILKYNRDSIATHMAKIALG
jgi:hypothetical protein